MSHTENKNILIDLLSQSSFRIYRYIFIASAITAITLAQSFFVFGSNLMIPTSTIYYYGIILSICTLTITYINIIFLAPYFLSKKSYITYIFTLVAIVFIFIFIKQTVESFIISNTGVLRKWNLITVLDVVSNMVLYTICIASTSISTLFRELIVDNYEIKNLEKNQLQNSLDNIKNRIQPAFLYDTLNYASQQVDLQPKNVSDTLFKLSELLRYQLYDCTRVKVLLTSDIAFIQKYLQLYQQNHGGDFSFDLFTHGHTNKLIAPSLIMPCVQELLKQKPKALSLHFNIDGECITIECHANGIASNQEQIHETEQKLNLIHGDSVFTKKAKDTLTIYLRLC